MFRFTDSSAGTNSRPDDGRWISLKRLNHPTQLIYGSALPQQLGREQAAGLASWLVDQCDRLRQGTHPLLLDQAEVFSPGLRSLLREFTVMATPAATLQIQWHDRAIAHWLTIILTTDFSPAVQSLASGRSPSPQQLWTVQYAHARCCSLLRHAQSLAWIPLVPSAEGSGANAMPWQWTGATVLWQPDGEPLALEHPSQWPVIEMLLALLDQWAESGETGETEWRLAEQLSQAFQAFYAACPPFATVRWQNRDRASGYIAFIVVIQRLLWCVLMRRGVVIPVQL